MESRTSSEADAQLALARYGRAMATAVVSSLRARWPLRGFRADLLLALLLLTWAVIETLAVEGVEASTAPALALGGLLTLPLAWRRRAPTAVVLLVFTGIVLAGEDEGMYAIASFTIALYSVGAYASPRRSMLALAAAAVAMGVDLAAGSRTFGEWLENLLFIYVLGGGLWAAGRVVRRSRSRASQLEDLTVELEREREEKARLAAAEERARIARELHDVIAHSLSVMVVQAGAGEHVLEQDTARAREAFRSIEQAGRQALTDMRRMLGLLRSVREEPSVSPQPTVAEAGTLVRQACEAGLPAHLRVEGEVRPLPPGLDLAAYRVLQEALTNAIKHAPGAPTSVVVRYGPRTLEVQVENEAPRDSARQVPTGDGAGHGHLGMRERIGLYGGELELGPRSEGGYRVRAALPLEEPPR
jgi:signal transduction histidine kinase